MAATGLPATYQVDEHRILEDYTKVTLGELLPLPELRAAEGFGWACRQAVTCDRGYFYATVCETSGSTREGYLAHMREYHPRTVRQNQLKITYDPKPWKAPRATREYQPKPLSPGEPVKYTRITGGHHEGEYNPARPRDSWIPEVREARTGTVWSVADSPSALYVLPDDDPAHPVYVRRAGKHTLSRAEGEWYEVPGAAERDRRNLLRAETIRARGIFPVFRTEKGWRPADTDERHVTWHSDPSCPRIGDDQPYDPAEHGPAHGYHTPRHGTWTTTDVALTLTRPGQPPSCLCKDCITGLPVQDR